MTIGAQAFGEHVGIAAIVLVARQAKARAQRLDSTTAHHDHLEPNRHQRVHDRAIWSLDRDTAGPGARKAIAQLAEPSGAVGHRELVEPWYPSHRRCTRDARRSPNQQRRIGLCHAP